MFFLGDNLYQLFSNRLVLRDAPKLKNVFQSASICLLPTLLLCSDPLHKVEILEVNMQDLPQRLKSLLRDPVIRKFMFHRGNVAGTFFFMATQCVLFLLCSIVLILTLFSFMCKVTLQVNLQIKFRMQ